MKETAEILIGICVLYTFYRIVRFFIIGLSPEKPVPAPVRNKKRKR